MAHPLYHRAMRLVGTPVYAHHIDGRVFQGVVHSVNANGVYMLNCRTAYLASFQEINTKYDFTPGKSEVDSTLVYAPAAFFAFGALTGFTVGALAGRYWW